MYKENKAFREWYHANRRALPWKNTKDPYRIWLSEIILQQTRVEQGIPYFLAFEKAFPVLQDLAEASEDEVLRLWQGLGYYSRARNLHHTARQICTESGGRFPETVEGLLKLKGIGPYTAAAIASFAFGVAEPAIDGNAIRIISRIFGISDSPYRPEGAAKIKAAAEKLLWKDDPGGFNQAIMDLGSSVCSPRNPSCSDCPWHSSCSACKSGEPEKFPAPKPKITRSQRWFHFVLPQYGEYCFIEKRTQKDIWSGLYQFPLLESSSRKKTPAACLPGLENGFLTEAELPWEKHLLTHRDIWHCLTVVRLNYLPSAIPESWIRIKSSDLFNFAFPKVVTTYIEKLRIGL